MISIWKTTDKKMVKSIVLERNSWVEVANPSESEIEFLNVEHQIPEDLILDILDEDERSRIEITNYYTCLITRVPVYDETREVRYFTVPLGIIISNGLVFTICSRPSAILDAVAKKIGSVADSNVYTFMLEILNKSITNYLQYLKQINKLTSRIEEDLQNAVKNTELLQLLRLEKSLLFFTTSLKGNEMLLERFEKLFDSKLSSSQREALEDLRIEVRQAQEMTSIYSNILSGMMDILASVISNNLNVVMKRLTQISIVLMIPTFIASLYGMNVSHLPFHDKSWAFPAILGVSTALALISAMFVSRQKKF
ncbi:magnesium transporter CorA family protein [Spirochaeta cellobiosiphila]|uniref:magnesium transporter CorA family protein n=1 Tax=Spirochaeta cellobiosiphila TaxID=504483 RepID=UPI00040A5AC1|nr:magnesium transporter CorA family protein [Spirochaeta cellobiosiphila]